MISASAKLVSKFSCAPRSVRTTTPAFAADAFWGYLIAGHGLYAWGRDLAEARRQRAAREDGIHAISALTGEGIEALLEDVAVKLQGVRHVEEFTLSFAQGKQRAWLFQQDVVVSEEQGEEGFDLTVRWTDKQKAQFNAL